MIDNIEFLLGENALEGWQINKHIKTTAWGAKWVGSVRNMKIIPRLHGSKVVEMRVCGSLAKWYRGENFTALTRPEIQESLNTLADVLEVDLRKAVLCSVEIGCSVPLRGAVSLYLNLFGNAFGAYRRMNIYNQSGTLETVAYFLRSGLSDFKFYDKVAEAKTNGDEIPVIWRGEVLRAEYRLRKRASIKAKFGRDLSPMDLNTPIYDELKRLFLEFYTKIQKGGRLSYIDVSMAKTPKDVDLLAFSYMVQHAPDTLSRIVDALKDSSNADTVKRLKKKIKDASTCPQSLISADIAEIDSFITQKCGL